MYVYVISKVIKNDTKSKLQSGDAKYAGIDFQGIAIGNGIMSAHHQVREIFLAPLLIAIY